VVRKPLPILFQADGLIPLTTVDQFQSQQFPQEKRTFWPRRVAEVVLNPWPLARFPGGLEAVTKFVNALQPRRRRRLIAGAQLVAHGDDFLVRWVRIADPRIITAGRSRRNHAD
jgi:hypothetical protein